MGISFEAPLALLLLIPALVLTIGLHARSAAADGYRSPSCRPGPADGAAAALVLAIAGFQLVLPVDRLATVFVVDLSDSVGNRGPLGGPGVPARDAQGEARGRRRGHRRVRQGRPRRAAAVRARGHRPHRVGAGQVRHRHRGGPAAGVGALPRRRPEADRAAERRQRHDRLRPGRGAPSPPSRGVEIETRQIGLGDADEVLVERLTTPSTARLGESMEAVAEIRSSVAQPATVFLFADGTEVASQPVRLEAGITRVTFDLKPTEAGFHTFRVRVEAALRHVQRERPGRLQHHRQGRAEDPGPRRQRRGRRRAGRGPREPAPAGRHDGPGGPPDRLRRPRHVRQRRPRRRARGSASRTASWPRSRSTSATSARDW